MIYQKQLKELRNKNSLTQQDLANILKIKRGVYSLYETEYVIMPVKHLLTVCEYFNISLDYIFGFSKKMNYKDNKQNVEKELSGLRLKELRKSLNLTQEKLAQKLNVARSIIGEYEKGNVLISTHALYTLCKKHNVSADYLLGKINNREE